MSDRTLPRRRTARALPPAMTLWRLELLRVWRTRRWLLVLGVYAFFGVLGPVTARYLEDILTRFGGGVEITAAPPPTPATAIGQFIGNAGQLGLLAVLVVAAGALALDTRPELAAFLRTKVPSPSRLLLPRYVVTTALAGSALLTGTVVAWLLTAALIGRPPTGPLVVGTLLGALFLAFAVAVVAAVAGYTRSQAGTVFAALAVLLALPVVGIVDAVGVWLPSQLLGAAAALVDGVPAGEYARPVVVTVVATATLLALAVRRFAAREL
jgi:ABC-2 type transport system permease protein